MSELSYFLAGFLTASTLSFSAAFLYYRRARNRVLEIERAIHNYNEAMDVLGGAGGKAYGKKQ